MSTPVCTTPEPSTPAEWEAIGSQSNPSWYLDRLVAQQKRRVHQELVRRGARGLSVKRVLKTDAFEEAHGDDHILFDLFPGDVVAIGTDVAFETAHRAQARFGKGNPGFLAADVMDLPVRSASVDVVVSTSTLDHLGTPRELAQALSEVARVLRPGGVAVVTMDNPENPLYPLLRWVGRRGWLPFSLGHTVSLRGIVCSLECAGLEVFATDTLIHNPRLISTLLFLGLRRALGSYADAPIRALLACFDALGRTPARRYSACFVAACARKTEIGYNKPRRIPHA